ncbi:MULTISPECIES: ankyrin repeat domain-containing protein [Geobacter]|uniref:Ankyrin n=2 Tax=Geobacter TaxID=28231 RepID=A0A0C1TS73_9BACT|nr:MULTISPECIES: ankyrin repeat domain-containing protein [Geobacter]ANA41519.1 hypothetical protein A2G06_16235 [Geobacter anodireducens]KIE43719.1 ankyrin [Geobacter soli]MBE2889248.1 ankyrin repeat domain-containing protein [Geobacter anodireducens]HMN02307.1 ankyrin repeat domain-containing protein [Geobacter anodireducens]
MVENVNTKDKHGHTPLIDAAKAGEVDAIRDLIGRGADLEAKSEKGKTALHYAAANGQAAAIRALLEAGAQVDPRDLEWHTPLMLAANYGCNECVEDLLTAGADPLAKMKLGNTALTYAEANGHPDTLDLIKKAQRAKSGTA